MPQEGPKLVGYRVPKSNQYLIRIVLATVIMTLAILAILPFTQALSGDPRDRTIRSIDTANIPPPEPPPPEPPPPEEEEPEPDVRDLDTTPPPLSLAQLESALNPGIGEGLMGGVGLDMFGIAPDVGSEMQIFELSDLDRRPRRLAAVAPQFPPEFQIQGLAGEVRVRILIDEQGNVSVLDVISATHREAIQPVRQALARWRFEPPQRQGEAVRAAYIQPFSYNFRN